jgi:hypothetical protein
MKLVFHLTYTYRSTTLHGVRTEKMMTRTVKALLKTRSFLRGEEEVRLYPVSDSTISMRQASSAQSAFDKRLYKVLAIIEIRL